MLNKYETNKLNQFLTNYAFVIKQQRTKCTSTNPINKCHDM